MFFTLKLPPHHSPSPALASPGRPPQPRVLRADARRRAGQRLRAWLVGG